MYSLILILVFGIIILVGLIYFCYTRINSHIDEKSTAVILTCTVNVAEQITYLKQKDPKKRLGLYLKSIEQWLNNTNCMIIVVDNSGYSFGELRQKYAHKFDRFEILSFTYDHIDPDIKSYLDSAKSKGQHEMYALRYAKEHSRLLPKAKYVFKVTGRYYIPKFKDELKLVNIRRADCFSQNSPKRCELVGFKANKYDKIFTFPADYDHTEIHYFNKYEKECSKLHKFRPMKIEATPRGNNDLPITDL